MQDSFCGGIVIANKLITYRLKEKINKHNGMIEREYAAETAIIALQHDVQDLKSQETARKDPWIV